MSRTKDAEERANDGLAESHAALSRMMRRGRSFSGHERNTAFLNTGADLRAGGRFADVSATSGLDLEDDGRGLAASDWDHDGDLDLIVSNRNAPRVRFLRNLAGAENRFLSVTLVGDGVRTNKDAIGARVEVVTGDPLPLRRTLRAGEGFLAQSSKRLVVGLGSGDVEVKRVVVHWPGGEAETFEGLRADRHYELRQHEGVAREWRRPSPATALRPGLVELPRTPGSVRVPLVTLVPAPALDYASFDGEPRELTFGGGRAKLVNLWASWCAPCAAELTELGARCAELERAGIDVVALSVDGLGDERADATAAPALLERLGVTLPAGYATTKLVGALQTLRDLVLPLDLPLPVPTSFLVDAQGRLSVIYLGPLDVDQLLGDLETPESRSQRLVRAAPLPGSVIDADGVLRADALDAARTYSYFATLMESAGRDAEAVRAYEEVLAIDPGSPSAHFNLGRLSEAHGEERRAVDHYARALAANPDLPGAHAAQGELLLRLGETSRALFHLDRAIERDPASVTARTNRAAALAALGRLDEALEELRATLALDAEALVARYNLAVLLANGGQPAEAIAELERLLSIDMDYRGANAALARLYEAAGKRERAASCVRRALELDPENEELRAILKRLED